MTHAPGWLVLAACLALLQGGPVAGQEKVDYLRSVKPILAARCYSCHGALQQKRNLRLDTVALMRQGGDSGPAIVPGAAGKSLLLDHVRGTNGAARMPPRSEGEPLSPNQIDLIKRWIDEGATGPDDEKPETDPRDHWAFKPPVRPAIPRATRSGNPIDAFIAAGHARLGLKPQPPADRVVLLRRVHLDLVGLPPTREEIAAFVADNRADAYERVVDRLLASPRYGERWGRHWLDIWRYSDWWGLGAEVRNSQKHIRHWRDWVIESVNSDKGYDQMIREMLAADELYPNDLGRLRATGYLARPYFLFNRNSWLDDLLEHLSKGFLGLTFNCARCHDHKYDPINQPDYYRLRAFFEPYQIRTEMVPGEADFQKDGIPRAFDCNPEAPTYLFVRGDEKMPRKTRPLLPGLPELLAPNGLQIRPVTLPLEAHTPGLRPFVLETHLRQAEARIAAARLALTQAREKPPKAEVEAKLALDLAVKSLAAAELQPALLKARAAADRARFSQPPAKNARELARVAALAEKKAALATAEENLARAELELARAAANARKAAEQKRNTARAARDQASKALENPGETYTSLRGALKTKESNVESAASLEKPFPTTSTGRRSALAAWMTDAKNPLTARVAVNHVWARHFGRPLVATVFDFGRKGALPTHPELLDWLACDLVENGWSIKRLHRLIVTSDAYRRTSSPAGADSANRSKDGDNRYLWRMNPLRMEAQVVRDTLLYLAGELDERLGGPTIPANDEKSRRRSLYFFHSHNEYNRFLAIFDDANVLECYRRAESVVPQQALALQNSRLALDSAEKVARRITASDDAGFVRAAFETVLGVAPTAEELAACLEALQAWRELAGREKKPQPDFRARVNLVHTLFNHNDFLTVR